MQVHECKVYENLDNRKVRKLKKKIKTSLFFIIISFFLR